MPMQGGLSIERMCELARVNRTGFYRSLQERAPAEGDVEVRSAIQQIALEHGRRYGYRRVAAELRRRGMLVNYGELVVFILISTPMELYTDSGIQWSESRAWSGYHDGIPGAHRNPVYCRDGADRNRWRYGSRVFLFKTLLHYWRSRSARVFTGWRTLV